MGININNDKLIIDLMKDYGYHSEIKGHIIYYHRFNMENYEFKINLNDIKLNLPESIVRYLTSYYKLTFEEQIKIMDKIDLREERLNKILNSGR